ncbi:MAG TPA: hypothetical protein PKL83_05040, partial [bacterium]|nr:hypothetical protein [bacterium]
MPEEILDLDKTRQQISNTLDQFVPEPGSEAETAAVNLTARDHLENLQHPEADQQVIREAFTDVNITSLELAHAMKLEVYDELHRVEAQLQKHVRQQDTLKVMELMRRYANLKYFYRELLAKTSRELAHETAPLPVDIEASITALRDHFQQELTTLQNQLKEPGISVETILDLSTRLQAAALRFEDADRLLSDP